MTFFLTSVAMYGLLVGWLAVHLQALSGEWGFALAHLAIAAAVNAHFFAAVRARSLALLSPPVAYLTVSQIYFTVNGLKYFSPIILYPQFDLSLAAQFIGSAAGGAVLFLGGLMLRRQHGPSSGRLFGWVDRHMGELRRLMVVAVIGSIACKVALFQLGYGSTYTETTYTDAVVRRYGDFFIILGNEIFGFIALLLGLLYLMRPKPLGRVRPIAWTSALLGVLVQVGYSLLYLKARMILLLTFVIFGLAAEARSRRLGERVLQTLFVLLPAVSLLGVQLTLWIGRTNIPEETGLRLAIAAVNRRADLTDFATAILVDSRGEAHDARIITSAMLNAVPRVMFPDKQLFVTDVYSRVLDDHLGWPAYDKGETLADYQDSAFSAGVMSFGAIGFIVVPLALVALFHAAARWIGGTFRGSLYGVVLLALSLAAMRVEVEWATIPLNFRQAISIAVVCTLIVWVVGGLHRVVVVASRTPPRVRTAGGLA
ncbi:MAG: hypothetical protein H0W67_08255 [Gemmatimonadales bacterium]|nr:hypothetical protein [Gemmatimonadales bacterium]